MTRARNAALILLCVLLAASASAQSKGNARINGKILDDQGKPAAAVSGAGAQGRRVHSRWSRKRTTRASGRWKGWRPAAGTSSSSRRVSIRSGCRSRSPNRNPPIDMKLTKAAPAVDPNVELQDGMKKAVELQKAGKVPEARKIIEDLIAKYPPAYRLNAFVASTYESEKNFDKAIEHMKIVVEKEPADIDMKTYLAELYTHEGRQGRSAEDARIDRHDAGQGSDALHQLGHHAPSTPAGPTRRSPRSTSSTSSSPPSRTSSTTAPAPTSWARRWSRPRRISRSSCRSRRRMRASCRMPKSFSNSSKTSSKSALTVACPGRPRARRVRRLGRLRRNATPAARRRSPACAGSLHGDRRRGRRTRYPAVCHGAGRQIWPFARRNAPTATRAGGCSTRLWLNASRADRISRPDAAAAGRDADRRRRDRRHAGRRRSHRAAQRLRPPQPRAALHAQRQPAATTSRRIDGTFRTTLGNRADADRRRQRVAERRRSGSPSTAGRRRPRSSTPTATSRSSRKIAPAPSATSRGC